MERKKKIAISLAVIWAFLIIIRLFSSGDERKRLVTATTERATRQIDVRVQNRAVKYPELKGFSVKKDLFSDLIGKTKDNASVDKEKKQEIKAAPPLPVLPEQPKIVKVENTVEKIDPLKDIILIGILDKKSKRLAFIKKGNDIKSFSRNDKIFDTDYRIDRIGKTEVQLINDGGDFRILKLDKEVADDKKD